MKKKSLFAAAAAVMMLFSGCMFLSPAPSYDMSYAESIPAQEWTAESIGNVSYLRDVNLTYPLSLSKFGDKYSYDTAALGTEKNLSISIHYLGHHVANTVLDTTAVSDITISTEIQKIVMYEGCPDYSINGVTCGSTKEEVIAALGEPDYINDKETLIQYDDAQTGKCLLSFVMRDGKVMISTINFSGEDTWKEGRTQKTETE